jgi:hypothetical protein
MVGKYLGDDNLEDPGFQENLDVPWIQVSEAAPRIIDLCRRFPECMDRLDRAWSGQAQQQNEPQASLGHALVSGS